MLRRTVVSLIALSAALLISAGPSHAQSDDYAAQCAIQVSPTTAQPGSTVTVTGTNFPTSPATVPIKIGSQQVGTAHIGSNGSFSDPATIPAGLSGSQTISVACASTGVDATTAVNVQAATQPNPPGAPLARTGSDTQPLVLAGLGAVAVGTALVLTARRRRASRTAA
jgi:LPXTG-motif cell wall-anchored protein